MESMTLLCLEHKRIASMARQLAATVSQEAAPDPTSFHQFRREFGAALAVHLNREDWVVYPALFVSKRPEVRALASRLSADANHFSSSFRDYNRRWTTVCIAADWAGFREETLAMIARLQRRIAVEDCELYPLLDDIERHSTTPAREAEEARHVHDRNATRA
jgi:hypothetical protein